MQDRETRQAGAGPFTFEPPALDPGESWRIDLEKTDKGRYFRYVPFDVVLVKNYDSSNRIDVQINGRTNAAVDIDPNGKDSYGEVPIRTLRVINRGTGTIAEGDVTLSVKRDPFDADDAARVEADRGPIERIIRNNIGL
jgi:hypothetical protein